MANELRQTFKSLADAIRSKSTSAVKGTYSPLTMPQNLPVTKRLNAGINDMVGDIVGTTWTRQTTPFRVESAELTNVPYLGMRYAFSFSPVSSVSFPNLSSIDGWGGFASCFERCSSLVDVDLSRLSHASSTSINGLFNECTQLSVVSLSAATSIPSIASNTFPTDAQNPNYKVLVPAELYDQWVVATNWINISAHIVPVSPVSDENTRVKYTTESGLPDWEGDIVGTLSGTIQGWQPTPTTQIPDVSSAQEVTIGSNVTEITNGAFGNCATLSNVTIPSSVTSIGLRVFQACTGLTSVTIPSSVTSIGNYAFNSCSGITDMTIPSSVLSIGMGVFQNCTNLTSVTIANGVTSIGGSAFRNTALTSVTIPNSVTSIGSGVFYDCANLMSVTMTGKTISEVQGMSNYSWNLPTGCVIHCSDGDITI